MAPLGDASHETTGVIICGGGPTGVMLSAMLGQIKVPNVVLEREQEIVTDPRGIALDEDGIRCFQSIGMYHRMFSQIALCQKMFFIAGSSNNLHKQPFLVQDLTKSNGPTGHVGFVFHKQPELEKAIRDAVSAYPSAELRVGCTVESISEDSKQVHVQYVDAQKRKRKLSAPFLVGADGKTGYVRKMYLEPRGVKLERCEGTNYDETWVALNWRIRLPTPETHPDFPLWQAGYTPELVYDAYFPPNFRFLCNPSRPSVCGRFGLQSDRLWRFEFIVQAGEDPHEMATFEGTSKVIFPYITHPGHWYGMKEPVRFPEDCIETLRSRPFNFLARSCNRWADGRVILVGDAAHVFPPFGGQGIASGFRDAAALAWRLCHLYRTSGVDYGRILESWYIERKQQLETSLASTVRNGEFVTNRGLLQSFVRDWVLWAVQLEPHCRRWMQEGTRPGHKYNHRPGLPFLPHLGGGVLLPQVYARRLAEGTSRVQLTDDIFFDAQKNGLLQLLVLLDKVEAAEQAMRDIDGVAELCSGLVSEEQATFLVHDFDAATQENTNPGKPWIARIASAKEYTESELCTRRPAPASYDACRIIKDLRPKAKYVIVRRDRYVYAATVDAKELREAARALGHSLCVN